jgi:glucose/arabinose dehydrogenase
MKPPRLPMRLTPTLMAFALAAAACSPGQSPGPSTARPGTAAPTGTPPPTGTSSTGTRPPATDGPAGSPGPLDLESLTVTLEPFVTIEGGPLAMTAPDDGTGRLFVAAQDGRIWVIQDGTVLPDPAVDLGPRLRSGGEQGLLGIAVHPGFPTDQRIFVNYTDEAGDTIVASLEIDPNDGNRIDPDSHRRLLFIDQPYANHNGGAVLFGPDGYLYVFMGDGGSGGDPQGNGQNRQALLGKVLRIDIDGATGDLDYGVPPDNPFAGGGGRDEIWHLGLRNPWRASFDRASGDLWIGDVGQGDWEEIDVARAGVGGLNYGWNTMEGAHCFGESACNQEGMTLPVTEYGRDLGCTVIGGYVYRGARYPALSGAYVFADFCDGRLFAIDSTTDGLVPPVEVGIASAGLSAFGEDAEGELYVLNLDGNVSRLVASAR